VWGYVRYRLDSIRTIAAPHLTQTPSGAPDSAAGLPPENILLIGNQTRAGLTDPNEIAQLGSPQALSGSLSDVIMILHLDPAKETASILSIPRDLFVPMPPGSPVGPYQKIDAALNDGTKGPDNLIQAITNDLGIPINHYVELEFDGFQNTVNALGGINVDFPEPLFDAQSLLDITTTGCVHLNGRQALALVRARHLQYDPPGDTAPQYSWPYDPESDLSRIVRDHTFLRILASTARSKGLTDPLTLNAFLGAIINQIIVDPGLKGQLVSLAAHYRHLDPATFPELTLPITTVSGNYYYAGADIGDVDFPVQPADNEVIAQWDGTALPKPIKPVAVNVYNLAGTSNLASTTAAALKAVGEPAKVGGDTATPATSTETLIGYGPRSLPQALSVMSHMSGAIMLDPIASLPAGTISVQAGSLLSIDGLRTGVAPTPTTAAHPTTSSSPSSSSPTAATSTTLASGPTPGGQSPSSSADQQQPWDLRPCPAKP
jgi:LCP family protein required for cell wall assembly